jgi:hypothetical protein
MSTEPPAPEHGHEHAPPPAPHPAYTPPEAKEIIIVSHSMLFYWWPVWAVGLLLGILSFVEGRLVAIVPDGTDASRKHPIAVTNPDGTTKTEPREGYILPRGKHLLPDRPEDNLPDKPDEPHLRMTSHSSYGVLWATVLLLVIVITNVPLRGLWSVVVIIFIVLIAVIFALLGWWDAILGAIKLLDIRINAGGYFFISLILFGIWILTMLLFDRQIYMVFTPGQLRVCQEIGGGETAYDTTGMVIQKQRSDLFRHWILGLGSGDVVVRTSGANSHEFQMHNVLFVGHKLQMIEQMQRDRPVVKGAV